MKTTIDITTIDITTIDITTIEITTTIDENYHSNNFDK